MKAYRLVGMPLILLGVLYGLGPEPNLFGFGHTLSPPTLLLGGSMVLIGLRLCTLRAAGTGE